VSVSLSDYGGGDESAFRASKPLRLKDTLSGKIMQAWFVAAMGALIMALGGVAAAEPMTREQGDAILKELREIRNLLARQQQQQAPQAAPEMPREMTVKADGTYVLGRSDAPLTMVEFTDYQCPYCGRFEANTYPELKRKYIDTGKMRLVVRDLPLEGLHPFAMKAAQAVHCAGDQGKFWEMKELLFKNQNKLDADSLSGYATKDLALDAVSFRRCMDDGKHVKDIADEVRYAQSLGITGTPTFVIGKSLGGSVHGKVIAGALPLENFDAVITEMLEKH
jgi:protein-disulfide isomerase